MTVKDALQQNVSDNTRVELISNWGSVIAGTGATLGFPGTGPVNPLASSAAATYNGVAIAYLLTSNNHVGAYEVVAAAGGTIMVEPHTDDDYYDSVKENGRWWLLRQPQRLRSWCSDHDPGNGDVFAAGGPCGPDGDGARDGYGIDHASEHR